VTVLLSLIDNIELAEEPIQEYCPFNANQNKADLLQHSSRA
jgi:hypothetical protein